jgi:hypothetical protein
VVVEVVVGVVVVVVVLAGAVVVVVLPGTVVVERNVAVSVAVWVWDVVTWTVLVFVRVTVLLW